MTAADKKALKRIATIYGFILKGTGMAGEIAGDRMFEQLVQKPPTRDQIDEIAAKHDAMTGLRSNESKTLHYAEFVKLVESVAKSSQPI